MGRYSEASTRCTTYSERRYDLEAGRPAISAMSAISAGLVGLMVNVRHTTHIQIFTRIQIFAQIRAALHSHIMSRARVMVRYVAMYAKLKDTSSIKYKPPWSIQCEDLPFQMLVLLIKSSPSGSQRSPLSLLSDRPFYNLRLLLPMKRSRAI